jgi:preprotein translocase subunit YajC
MFASPAQAQTPGPAGPSDFLTGNPLVIMIPLFGLFYFMIIRPQQKRMKEHQAMVANLKRGDTVVLNSGVVGKVTRIDDTEAQVEIAQGVTIKVVKAMVSEVRARTETIANDAKG